MIPGVAALPVDSPVPNQVPGELAFARCSESFLWPLFRAGWKVVLFFLIVFVDFLQRHGRELHAQKYCSRSRRSACS